LNKIGEAIETQKDAEGFLFRGGLLPAGTITKRRRAVARH
jgi:hypothetical protein